MNKKVIIISAILVAGLIGWRLGSSDKSNRTPSPAPTPAANSNANSEVKALVSYKLPDAWREASCPSSADTVYVVPNGADVDCNANPSSPVKISVDPAGSKDCNQLQNVQNVRKHICVSVFIDGRQTLKSETIYNQDSSYGEETTINAYYVDTGKGVVKLEHIASGGNNFQAGFDELANSVKVKG